MKNTLLSTAISMAKAGVPVFPVRPGHKEPMTRHGLHDATTDLEIVTSWWSRCPTANIGMPTGTATVDVLDVDFVSASESGFGPFRRLREAGLCEGWHRVVRTPRSGLHVWFRPSGNRNGSMPRHHIDVRGDGGYILVPPSVVNGAEYRVIEDRPAEVGTLDWDAIKAVLNPRPKVDSTATRCFVRGNIATLGDWLSSVPEGGRNSSLFWAACRAVEAGVDDPDGLAPLVDIAVSIGLTQREAEATARSALRTYGRAA